MLNVNSDLLNKYITQVQNKQTAPASAVKKDIPKDTFVTPEKQKTKKAKIARIALIGATVLALGAAVFASIRYRGQIVKGSEKLLDKAKKGSGELEKYENGANNITNIKDAVTRKVFKKVPGYKKFDEFTSKIYKKSVLKSILKSHTKAQSATAKANEEILDAVKKSNLDNTAKERITSLLGKRQETINGFAKKNAVTKRFLKIDKSMKNLDEDVVARLKDIKDEGIKSAKKLTKESAASERLKGAKKIQEKLFDTNMGLSEQETKELNSLLEEIKDTKAIQQYRNAEKLLQKSIGRETSDMFGKLRDINCGSAPTDIMGILGTVGMLGLYTAQADTKEERVGVTLTTGVPLLTTLGTTVFATTKMVNGFKALGLGAATGLIAKVVGSSINKIYQKKHNTENNKTIVTFDDYSKIAKEMSKKLKKQKTAP